jgi:hypothetical protein
MSRLYTSNWATMARNEDRFESLGVVPVSISLTLPRFWQHSTIYPRLELLAPRGIFGKIPEGPEYDRAYLARLDLIGFDAIDDAMTEIRKDWPDRDLCLCCFEQDRRHCHRGIWAEWWTEQSAEIVDEWKVPEPQLSMEIPT